MAIAVFNNNNIDHSISEFSHPGFRAWCVVLIAATFFFYEFIQMNMFDSISTQLMQAFHVDAARLGILSSFYFIANVIFLVVAGILLDRASTRFVILTALLICIVGTALLSFAHTLGWACFFRFLTGIGSAFCFLSVIRLASRWFPNNRMALVIGLVVTIAMIGGFVAQTPMTILVAHVGWRSALQYDAGLGFLFFVLIFLFVRDYPTTHHDTHLEEQKHIQMLGYLNSMRIAFSQWRNWAVGLYIAILNSPLGALGGLWGAKYAVVVHHISTIQASVVVSSLFIGTIVGSPIMGLLSDVSGKRRIWMFLGAIVTLLLMLSLLYFSFSFETLCILFFCIGFFTSVQIIGYPLVAENSPRMITAMSVSVVNITIQGSIGFFQPFFGWLLDHHMQLRTGVISTQFAASDFQFAMWLFPILFAAVLLLTIALPASRLLSRH